MALVTYTPIYPSAGAAYTLPLILADDRTPIFSSSAARPVAEGWGSILASGLAPQFPSGALITVSFGLTPHALIARGYDGTIAGLETALFDFSQSIFFGGAGTLRDNLPTGTKAGLAGATITYQTTIAVVQSSPKVHREYGSDVAQIDVELFCPTAMWLDSAGGYHLIT